MRGQAAQDSGIWNFVGGYHLIEGTVVRAGGFGGVKGEARGPGTRMGEHEQPGRSCEASTHHQVREGDQCST